LFLGISTILNSLIILSLKETSQLTMAKLNQDLKSWSSSNKHQFFKVTPTDKEVIEGDTAEFQCQIGNLKGTVEWTKDGLLLGEFFNLLI